MWMRISPALPEETDFLWNRARSPACLGVLSKIMEILEKSDKGGGSSLAHVR